MAGRTRAKTKANRTMRNAKHCIAVADRERRKIFPGGQQRKLSYSTIEEAEEAIRITTKNTVLQLETWSVYPCPYAKDEVHYHIGREDKIRPKQLAQAELERILSTAGLERSGAKHRHRERKARDADATGNRNILPDRGARAPVPAV